MPQVGIRVYDEKGRAAGTLWQHLSAREATATLDEEGIGALRGWSGTWLPSKPSITGSYQYKIVRRKKAINPARKSVSLKNFTGTVTRKPDGSVVVREKRKTAKRKR